MDPEGRVYHLKRRCHLLLLSTLISTVCNRLFASGMAAIACDLGNILLRRIPAMIAAK